MTVDELTTANLELDLHLQNTLKVRDTKKFKDKFKNQPLPEINPAFTALRNAVMEEIQKRENQ